MAYTIDQYNKLKAVIAQGTQFVKYADKEVRNRNLDEMLQTLALMEDELGLNGGPGSPGNRRIVRGGFAKGIERERR